MQPCMQPHATPSAHLCATGPRHTRCQGDARRVEGLAGAIGGCDSAGRGPGVVRGARALTRARARTAAGSWRRRSIASPGFPRATLTARLAEGALAAREHAAAAVVLHTADLAAGAHRLGHAGRRRLGDRHAGRARAGSVAGVAAVAFAALGRVKNGGGAQGVSSSGWGLGAPVLSIAACGGGRCCCGQRGAARVQPTLVTLPRAAVRLTRISLPQPGVLRVGDGERV